jgi:hypothetical protein
MKKFLCYKLSCNALFVVLVSGLFFWVTPGNLWSQPTEPATVIQDTGLILVLHGSDCGESWKRGEQNTIELTGKIKMPQWANQGTVFLNGWEVKYLSGDHGFGELGVVIHDIAVSNGLLEWKAISLLADDNFDDPYKACYTYTALVWNDGKIDAHPFHADGNTDPSTGACSGNQNFGELHANTALSQLTLSSYVFDKSFSSVKEVAVLPRGFSFAYLPYAKTDHHLLQIAYNFDHIERFIRQSGYGHLAKPLAATNTSQITSQINSGYVSWQTMTILKDNNDRQDYRFWEFFSAVAGDDVGIIQPPFAIQPIFHTDGACSSSPGGIETEDHIIEKVPFEYAVPVLTGWDLSYACGEDENVKELGVWLHDLQWDKKPGDLFGTLRYKISSILVDDDLKPSHLSSHKVQVFGIKGIVPLPDLVPVPTMGNTGYCIRNSVGGLTIVIHNQGNVDAMASITTVDLSTHGSFDIPTPAIPVGSTATLDTPPLPPTCFNANCHFTIKADSAKTVKESNEANNEVSDGCKG